MDTPLGWTNASFLRGRLHGALDDIRDQELERGVFAGLAAFVAIWTFMLAALMAASISDDIKPAESDIDIATIEPPVPTYTPAPEAPAPVYSLPPVDATAAPSSPAAPADEVIATSDGEDRITIERNPQTNMPTKITIVGRNKTNMPTKITIVGRNTGRKQSAGVITSEPVANRTPPDARPAEVMRSTEVTRPAEVTRPVEAPPQTGQDAATRVIDDIF